LNKDAKVFEKTYNKFSRWIESIIDNKTIENDVAFRFDIYEDGKDKYSIDCMFEKRVIEDGSFDWEDISEPSEEPLFIIKRLKFRKWQEVLEFVINLIKNYLQNGQEKAVLLNASRVTTGFVDGDLELLHQQPEIQ